MPSTLTAVLLGLATLGLAGTLLGAMVFMVVGPSADNWLRRPWLGRSPLQWWVVCALGLTALALLSLVIEWPGNPSKFGLPALAALMTVAVFGGRGHRIALWCAAALVLFALVTAVSQ